MNIQTNKSGKPDALGRLSRLWGLTPANEELARAYLTNDPADESLLSGAQRQIFSSFGWQDQWEISNLLKEVTGPDYTKNQAKVLRLLWAIGGSTAGFAALFDYHYINDHDTASDRAYRQRVEVLGQAAAAAMDAEYSAALPAGYIQTARLHQLAKAEPATLLEAQALIADPRNSMADGVLAGVLLANTDPVQEQPGLLGKLLGTSAGSRRAKAGTRTEQQVNLLLAWAEAIVEGTAGSGLSPADIGNLKAYIRAGDLSAPVPSTQRPMAWQLPDEDIFGCFLAKRSAVECMSASLMLGLRHDDRLACAFRVLAGLDLHAVLWGVLYFLPKEWDVSVLDTLLPHIPGGAVTILRFIVKGFVQQHEAAAKKIAHRYYKSADEALRCCSLDEYAILCSLLPTVKSGGSGARMEQLKGRMIAILEKVFNTGPEQSIVHDYLSGQGNFSDSAALLKPIRNEYRYISGTQNVLYEYRKTAGWDEFACRCIVLSCLTCVGYGTFSSFPLNADKKRNMDEFVSALIAKGLPVRDCFTVLATLYENWYQEEARKLIDAAIQEHFVTPAGVDALADAALNSSATARIMAITGLDALSAHPDCAEAARQALILCSADTSKQVQNVLLECYIRHPDWEPDYLAMLASKKAAQRTLAIRVLAGIGVDKYRDTLEKALAIEKNAKVMDQITALLGTPAAAAGAGGQTPAELADQVLKGGKKRKVQWLLDQPLPTIHHTDEAHTAASEDQIAALFVAYADLGRMGRSDTAASIAADLEQKDLAALACEVWELWIKAGAQSKTKWVLSFAAVFGGAAMTPKLIHAINEWPQNARGAIACDAVAALSVSPDPAALVAVDSISRKFKFRQVKTAAAAALESAAHELGITPEELADRIVPTLNFAPDGTRVFDYGHRKFTVRLTSSLELAVTTEAGKTVKSMPAPGKTDDSELASAAYEAYKTLKKQIKTTITAQRARLELALSAQRCWDCGAWRKLFVENPIMHQFAISLIWGIYENGELKETFRYMEDGSFNTVDEDEYTLPSEASIGLVHPIEMEADVLAAWKQQLEDYEITQSIDQLSRPIYRIPADQNEATALETVAGRILNSLSLMGKLQGMGWYRGSVVDGGGFYTFYREDPSVGIGVELNFSGSFVGGDNDDVTVFDAVFYKAGTVQRGSYCYDEPKKDNIFSLGQVPARYYSEIVWQLERATASSTETDPDWRRKKY